MRSCGVSSVRIRVEACLFFFFFFVYTDHLPSRKRQVQLWNFGVQSMESKADLFCGPQADLPQGESDSELFGYDISTRYCTVPPVTSDFQVGTVDIRNNFLKLKPWGFQGYCSAMALVRQNAALNITKIDPQFVFFFKKKLQKTLVNYENRISNLEAELDDDHDEDDHDDEVGAMSGPTTMRSFSRKMRFFAYIVYRDSRGGFGTSET